MDCPTIYGNVTVEEVAIKSLRELIPDVISANEKFKSDLYLLQWLKAQNLHPGKTEVLIRRSLQWRKDVDIESDWNSEGFLEFKKQFGLLYRVAKQNCPVAYINVGAKDFRKEISLYGKATWMNYCSKYWAIVEDHLVNFNNMTNFDTSRISYACTKQITIIVNVNNFSAFQLASLDVIRLLVQNLSNMTNYFPAIFGLCIFINVNRVFRVVLKAIKPMLALPYLTLEVYGSDEREWRDRILQIMDEDQLDELMQSHAVPNNGWVDKEISPTFSVTSQ